MTTKQLRQGVSSANRVVRNLKLDTRPGQDVSEALRDIDELFGMDEASICLLYTSPSPRDRS